MEAQRVVGGRKTEGGRTMPGVSCDSFVPSPYSVSYCHLCGGNVMPVVSKLPLKPLTHLKFSSRHSAKPSSPMQMQ